MARLPLAVSLRIAAQNHQRWIRDRARRIAQEGPVPEEPPFYLDEFEPTAAFSASRKLISTAADDLSQITSGRVSTWVDQTGNARDLLQANAGLRPSPALFHDIPALNFEPSGNQMSGPNLPEYITPSSAYMVVSFVCRGIARSDQVGNRIVGDAAEGGFIVAHTSGGVSNVYGLQYDGAYKQTPEQEIALGSQYVVALRKDATKMYCQVNRGDEVEVDIGNFTAMNYAFQIGGPPDNPNKNHNGYIFELATWAVVPSEEDRATIMDAFMDAIGVPTEAPDLSGFPGAANTGYTGTLTDSAGTTISAPGLIEHKHFTGQVTIDVDGVTIRNCKFDAGNFYCVRVSDGITATVENCEFDGSTALVSVSAISGSGTFRNNNIYGVENGIVLTGPNCVVTGNYIHDLSGFGEAHYDCIECNGGQSGSAIYGNTLLCPAQTAAVNINNYFGGQNGILVHDNYMAGGTYTVYVAGDDVPEKTITNVRVYDNYIDKGVYGYFNLQFAPDTELTNNKDALTGLYLMETE